MPTFGHWLLNETLPEDLNFEGPVTKGALRKEMTELAKKDPKRYIKVVQDIKKLGDEVSTWEGISVGLDDIAPDHTNRDKVLNDALKRVRAAKTDDEKRKIIYETEDKIKDVTAKHPSDMAIMARSGGRGSIAQLMKTVASPVAAMDADGQAYPWMINHSYAQGLSPSETWIAGSEARRNAIASTGSVVEPGAVAKVVVTNMEDQVITDNDCGTRTGVQKPLDNRNIIGRYLSKPVAGFSRNELVTPSVVAKIRKSGTSIVEVRSPMTCDIKDSVCQKCMGQDARGQDYEIGMNVGSRSAQALTEPLTQFALNAKHGVRMVGGKSDKQLRGLTGFRVLTEVPKSFTEKATLAKHDGRVSKIQPAPQGGHFIFVGSSKHYAPPGLDPIVKVNDTVEMGDALSEGPPMPDEIVRAKGVGEGRRYLSEALNGLYERQGVDIDHRHTELLARKAINYVQIDNDPTDTLLEGDIVPFNRVQPLYHQNRESISVDKALKKSLATPVLHYSEGTRITPSVINTLKRNDISTIDVATKAPEFTPVMKSLIQTPLLRDDWMSRMSHRYLKKTLVEGAGFGSTSDTASTNPVAAFVANPNFGHRADGKYAMSEEEIKIARAGLLGRAAAKGKEVLLGRGPEAVNARLRQARAQGDQSAIRHIGDTGNYDNAAHDLLTIQRRYGDDVARSLNATDDAGRVTDHGMHRVREFDRNIGGMFSGQRFEDLTPDQLQKMRGMGIGDDILNPETWGRIQEQRGGALSRGAKGVGKALFGFNPLRTLRQRAETGGLLGRGGILRGELGVSPDMQRGWRDFKRSDDFRGKAEGLARVGLWGGMDAAGKGFTYGLPAYGVGRALTEKDPEGSRALNVATPAAEMVGWAGGLPLGMVGGTIAAGQVTNAGRNLTGRVSPSAREALRQERGEPPTPQTHVAQPRGHGSYSGMGPAPNDRRFYG